MNASQHFAISFATSLLVGVIMAVAVFLCSDWLEGFNIPPLVAAPVGFAIGHLAMRAYFKTFVRVRCPYGCGKSTARPIPGRNDRFRCDRCGQTF